MYFAVGGLPHSQLPAFNFTAKEQSARKLLLQDTEDPGAVADGPRAGKMARAMGKRRQASRPLAVPAIVAKAATSTSTRDGLIQPLPPDVKSLHSYMGGATGSVMKSKAKHWVQSEAGASWQKERLKLFRADEDISGDDS